MQTMTMDHARALEGLAFRGFRGDSDYAHIARLETAAWAADGMKFVTTVEEIANDWAHLHNCDVHRDVRLAEVDGAPVAYSRVNWVLNDAGEQVFWHNGVVDPAWRRRGIGRALFDWGVARLREVAGEHPHAGPRYFQTWAFGSMAGQIALAEQHGYTPFRYGFMMRRDLNEPIPDLPLPEGVEVRPVTRDQIRAIFLARNEAFRDHFGHRESTEQDYVAWENDPYTRMDLWQVAWDARTNEVAGEVRVAVVTPDNVTYGLERGWTDPISVRRPYRRQGLARALTARAMRALKTAGMTEACLGVDALNPNGALKLYESLGFEVEHRTFQYRKVMEG